jgi:Tfp pilus assembly protein FimT
MNRRRKMKRKDAGFTIYELLTVIAIIFILAGIALPGVRVMIANQRLSGAARDIQSMLQLSRLKAVKENADVVVEFSKSSGSYLAFVDDGGGNDLNRGNGFLDSGERIVRSESIHEAVTMKKVSFDEGNIIRFMNNGGSRGVGNVMLNNDYSRYMRISIKSTVGNSKIEISDDGISWK